MGREVWWQEDRPDEGGRTTIMHHTPDGLHETLPAPWDARTRVHEYGGRSYLVVPGHGIVFSHHPDQRLYLLTGRGEVRPLTPEPERPGCLRYAETTLHGDEVWCVRESHAADGRVTRAVVAVPLDGSAACREVATGSDFYAGLAFSPNGEHLAFICWNHPRLPWVSTELKIMRMESGKSWTVKGGQTESILAPQWLDDSTLYLISDWSGWWNIYQIGIYGTSSQALYPAEEEFARPLWRLGGKPYQILADGRLAVLHGQGGDQRLGILDPDDCTLADLDLDYNVWDSALTADGNLLVGVASGPTSGRTLIRLDLATGETAELRREIETPPHIAYLPIPHPVEIESRFGRMIHAYRHPPGNPTAEWRGLPPYVINVHGGPTGHADTALDLSKAYLTSRGIGILDLNYGGSSGYGRAYRDRLRGQWGVVDVEDAIASARWLLDARIASRVAIRGRSAGGWTVMAACAASTVFAGGVSVYGVSDLSTFNDTTHDFESRYVEWLVGPPDPILYDARQPLSSASSVRCPMLLLQGLDDPVVPPQQSTVFAAAMKDNGIPCTLITFAGESHGFRRADTQIKALEAEIAFYRDIFAD
ncbi:prolyl oligopeptidase family serine peptidase [Rhizohabitans arisaemae]|uniref:prolyl oligopeptidase family serine peptidase n=1 Tax=Rhizohabitans arisaemae TaxID=2720610 RepID=UPI0024B25C5F|nr:prolyl oligopeptidase family serine peptidase [Rhizohabitans arisaemae]